MDYLVEEIVHGITNMTRTTPASTAAIRSQPQMFVDNFPDAAKFVPSTFRRHRSLCERALACTGLVEANSKAKWVDLVSYMEGTSRHNSGTISSPSPVQTALNWVVEGQPDPSQSWEGFDLWNAWCSMENMEHWPEGNGMMDRGDVDYNTI